ncbi:SLC13 family permease [Pelagibacterium sp. 26DY04]|uniref:SLC13 family permease n=1 Tax=Pelagibacterium sp. 26DY04 TaxID=2967130 RepID=UPI0028163DE3|nr:SLC13 family permease [Pelagibacterium sp. 26DY04]WMT86592.1 SLC13 family permease [Pelagibacterium sp. 26DY04]
MTYEQIVLFVLLVLVLAGLLWGRWRYDLVAFSALILGVILGVVPVDTAFSGFGDQATIIVALVLIVTAGLSRSGAVDLVTRYAISAERSLPAHISILSTLGAALSGFMNNVAALALLMPVDLQAAQKAGRSPAPSLMPLAYATILGGVVTLIGTPPNIIVSTYRQDALGEGYKMFDFAPVGLLIAIVGVVFISLWGWRLLPNRGGKQGAVAELRASGTYTAELVVTERSKAVGQKVRDLDEAANEHDCVIAGLIRRNRRLAGRARATTIKDGDLLVVYGTPDALSALAGALGLDHQGKSGERAELSSDLRMMEAIVAADSRLVDRSANDIRMLRGQGLSLLGISRQGRILTERVRRTPLKIGDVLLLLGQSETMDDAVARLGLLPMASSVSIVRHEKGLLAAGLFLGAVVASSFALVPLPIALGAVCILYVLLDILPVRDIYDAVEWPVIVLLGALLPVGAALETSGATALLAQNLAGVGQHLPGWVALAAILVVTMVLSDILNNAATAVIAAPLALALAQLLGLNPDSFLMAVAIGASCAFLTPIGHQNSALIMGPGGYRFADYVRLGLPLEIIVVIVAVPAIMVFWPL